MIDTGPLSEVIAEVEAQRGGDFLHDQAHACKVALSGLQIADLLERHTTARLTKPERIAVVLFGLLHDSKMGDRWDSGHGERAAEYARSLDLGKRLRITRTVLDRLYVALRDHEAGELSRDLLIATCWDADRLALWRQGIEPDPARLSTSVARSEWMVKWAFEVAKLSSDVEWGDLLALPGLSPSRAPRLGVQQHPNADGS